MGSLAAALYLATIYMYYSDCLQCKSNCLHSLFLRAYNYTSVSSYYHTIYRLSIAPYISTIFCTFFYIFCPNVAISSKLLLWYAAIKRAYHSKSLEDIAAHLRYSLYLLYSDITICPSLRVAGTSMILWLLEPRNLSIISFWDSMNSPSTSISVMDKISSV